MLKVVHLCSGYDSLRVIDGVSLHVELGEVVALVGANGSGKSTLLQTIAGQIPAQEGRVLLRGKDVAGRPANQIAAAGLTLVPEGRGLFPGMTVLDNLRMGGHARRLRPRALAGRVEAVCAMFPVLRDKLQKKAANLSGGEQQMLALARALAGEPDVLLLDEPSTGLAPLLAAEVFSKIQSLKQAGVTLIVAEQNISQALRIADRAYVMKTGRVVMAGPAEQVAESEEIKKAYLGM